MVFYGLPAKKKKSRDLVILIDYSYLIIQGSRGLSYEVWKETPKSDLSQISTLDSSAADYHSKVLLEAHSPKVFNKTSGYSSRLRTLFIAPWDDYYTFHIMCDDKCELHVSNSTDPSAKVSIFEYA